MPKSFVLQIPEAEMLRLGKLLDQVIAALRSLEETEAKRRVMCDQLAAESDKIFKENEAALMRIEQILSRPVPTFF
jgi:hypothetical protein